MQSLLARHRAWTSAFCAMSASGLWLLSCGSDDDQCPPGHERCGCASDDRCLEGLECLSGICVNPLSGNSGYDLRDGASAGSAGGGRGGSGGGGGGATAGAGGALSGAGGSADARSPDSGSGTQTGGRDGSSDGASGQCSGDCGSVVDPGILPNGLSVELTGSCSVNWQNLVTQGTGFCSYTLVPTLSGTASPLTGTLDIVEAAAGTKTAMIDVTSSVLSPTPLGVTFPGANGRHWSEVDLPLTLEAGGYRGSLNFDGTCGGACCAELIPHNIRYILDIDAAARTVSLSIGGSLPTSDHPNPMYCWCNQGSLSCNFSGTIQ